MPFIRPHTREWKQFISYTNNGSRTNILQPARLRGNFYAAYSLPFKRSVFTCSSAKTKVEQMEWLNPNFEELGPLLEKVERVSSYAKNATSSKSPPTTISIPKPLRCLHVRSNSFLRIFQLSFYS